MSMDIPLADFETREDTRRVIAKARQDKPYIKKLTWLDDFIKQRLYTCRGRTNKKTSGARYVVNLWEDTDGKRYGRCSCPAGTPPKDERTGELKYEPRACYHLAAVYFHHKAVMKRLVTLRARRSPHPQGASTELPGAHAA